MTPTITLHGTAPEQLIDDISAARAALSLALVCVSGTCPNGRDYRDFDELRQATNLHSERMNKLESVRAELLTLALSIQEQANI